ncbi:hypothetical protein JNUCC1_02498 [Lentibacillus sp. JNUCC-1]|uniref:hypothetical protein n=1 Tax=Lentibacillus sp. JNUCC-1 TaxID=2654513 RepID=UPI0012E9776C|nr:hypothetical protein [Lentibacillus sp. JNUCC-1]MUV38644.1 hypothetical protein [Lentibacillus sp. JNUCC-1]
MKFLLYQILAIGVIWGGMFFFREHFGSVEKAIFYVVTAWLIFLVLILIKNILTGQWKHNDQDPER